jgi:drug/metabolite transporter (DMT)-like permease
MNSLKVIAALIVVVGILSVAYGGFTYTKETHRADIGPMHIEVVEKEHVNIPLWAGIAAIVGGALLFASGRKI